MPRRPLIRSHDLPYHVTARANNREAFWLNHTEMWRIFNDELHLASIVYGAKVHAFVMMPNHFHLLMTVPEADLGTVMCGFLSYVTRIANLKSGRTGRVFGARYHWSLVNSGVYYAHALKYVYRNPVKAGLSQTVESHAFSTLHGVCGSSSLTVPLVKSRWEGEISTVPGELDALLNWLNRPWPGEIERSVRKALRRRRFEIPRDPRTRQPPEWVDTLA